MSVWSGPGQSPVTDSNSEGNGYQLFIKSRNILTTLVTMIWSSKLLYNDVAHVRVNYEIL